MRSSDVNPHVNRARLRVPASRAFEFWPALEQAPMTFAHTAAQSLTLRLQLPETPFALFYHSPTHATFLAFITRHVPVPGIPRHWGLRADGTAWCQLSPPGGGHSVGSRGRVPGPVRIQFCPSGSFTVGNYCGVVMSARRGCPQAPVSRESHDSLRH